MPEPWITKFCLKITHLKFHSIFPVANELNEYPANKSRHINPFEDHLFACRIHIQVPDFQLEMQKLTNRISYLDSSHSNGHQVTCDSLGWKFPIARLNFPFRAMNMSGRRQNCDHFAGNIFKFIHRIHVDSQRWLHCTLLDVLLSHDAPLLKYSLTHWGRDKMDAISQTTCSNAFSWMKMFEYRLEFHWNLFLRVQWTIFQHWFR